MKNTLPVFFFIIPFIANGQWGPYNHPWDNSFKDSVIQSSGQWLKTDSFIFCGKRFKLERDCTGKDNSKCCVAFHGGILCLNEDALIWHDSLDVRNAKEIFDGLVSRNANNKKSCVKKNLTCFILGNQSIESIYIETGFITGEKQNILFAYGKAGGRIVFIQLFTKEDLTGKKRIKSSFQNIISWK